MLGEESALHLLITSPESVLGSSPPLTVPQLQGGEVSGADSTDACPVVHGSQSPRGNSCAPPRCPRTYGPWKLSSEEAIFFIN